MSGGMTCGNIAMKVTGNPSDLVRAGFKSVLAQLSDLSPSDSMVNAHLTQENGKFKANIEIHSSELNVSIEKCGDSPVSLLGDVKHDLIKQISDWKKVRVVGSHSA